MTSREHKKLVEGSQLGQDQFTDLTNWKSKQANKAKRFMLVFHGINNSIEDCTKDIAR